ncbi:hypothetical protein GTY65_32550 [Streptomyces sp. SID8379]|uniref:hypothetical protein n=1 Tax=unclassified Streptomyces TaxID=2593676 RepID=UPI00036C8FE4|nr:MULTISPECIES: hypothetical protein [unclassified Streptomyces]MYW68773.1 hypothetical protein [Streptomyces sp. SID8379]
MTIFGRVRMLAHQLAEYEIDLVLESGARDGAFGRGLRRAGYRGRIVSFEPFGGARSGVRRIAARDTDWDVVPYALGDRDGTWMRRLDGMWEDVVAPGERVLLQVDEVAELPQVMDGAGVFGDDLTLVRTGAAREAAFA